MLVPSSGFRADGSGQGSVKLAILGSTGSIGRSALEIVRQHRTRFEVVSLAAGRNLELLAQQIAEFRPQYAVCSLAEDRSRLLNLIGSKGTAEILAGPEAITDIAGRSCHDVVLAAIVGVSGLPSVLAALKSSKRVALANKESLVAGGPFVAQALAGGSGAVIPVDSEHSALFQALQGERVGDIESLILTASGGPFLKTPMSELAAITPEVAVRHPRWNMGPKISVDSATLMNKALELIEAYWLFGVSEERIEVVVHPQSIVHSIVKLVDGSELAQLSTPDMKGPIAYALNYPHGRLPGVMKGLDLAGRSRLAFEALDSERFPAVNLARSALRAGPGATAVFNMANEVAVREFLRDKLRFDCIVSSVNNALELFGSSAVASVEALFALQADIERAAARFLASK